MDDITPRTWQKITVIFDAALDYEPSERHDFLINVCGGDEILLKRVESLLASSDEATNFIEAPMLKITPQINESSQIDTTREINWSDRFELQYRLGKAVYQVFDQKRNAIVVLKDLSSANIKIKRSLIENWLELNNIKHPYLVKLYDLITDEHHCYFTMEFIDGIDIINYIRKLQPHSLRPLLKQLAEAIMALHTVGKLHQAIKPANILVNLKAEVVVMGYGLGAEVLIPGYQYPSAENAAYLSPEQSASRKILPASDWYSFGVILYQALTGNLPFQGSYLEILMLKRKFNPPPPHNISADVPADLNQLCMKLLSYDPNSRPGGLEIIEILSL